MKGNKTMEYMLIVGIVILIIAWIFATIVAGKMVGRIGVVLYICYGLLIISPFVFALIGLKLGLIEAQMFQNF